MLAGRKSGWYHSRCMEHVAASVWNVLVVVSTIGGYIVAFALIVRIVEERKEATATLAWVLLIAFVPYLGAILYVTLGRRRFRRRTLRRIWARDRLLAAHWHAPHHDRPQQCAWVEEEKLDAVARLACMVSNEPLLGGNSVDVFISANRAYRCMLEEIDGAERHVHMLSYIFRPDRAGGMFVERLAAAARRGVEVRLLVDAFGSHPLGDEFVRPLVDAGGRFERFMPLWRFRPTYNPHMRNHRKLLVVDGKVGFTGGLNIGEEYQGRKKKYGPWRDTHLRVEGPAVWRLQEVFSEDWHFTTGENLMEEKYYFGFDEGRFPGEQVLQVVDSGPDKPRPSLYGVFFTAVTSATNHVYVTTPYFVPDAALLMALKAAAWRGVDVRLLLPGRSDLPLVTWAGRSFYRELLDAGVRIYEHGPGVLHAKTMVVDGVWATVGSANMDIRSFHLNFEVNVVSSGTQLAEQLERIFREDISRSREITLQGIDAEPRWYKFAASVCRVMSPVL